jgi:phage shock protein PspC (stress-responsive transcriptional regulator)
MNKTVNINLAGIFFHIDEDAYLKLQRYLEAIKRSFTDSQGRSEIISDIEARIAELFSERIHNDKQVVGIHLVDEVIAIMGQPEDYHIDDEIFEDEPTYQRANSNRSSKKLYRDTENSYIGGVSAGLSHYLGIEVLWVRLLWLLFAFLSGGTFIFIYLLFWALVPEAKTTAEKLTMTGEPVNISNIEKKIKDGIDTVTDKVKSVDFKAQGDKIKEGFDHVTENISEGVKKVDIQKQGNRLKSTSQNFFDNIGSILMFFLKLFAKFIGIILIVIGISSLVALIISLFTLGISDVANMNGMEYIYAANAADIPIWVISFLVFIAAAVPMFFLFYLGLKILVTNLKSIGRIAKFSLIGLWIAAVITLSIFGIRTASEYSLEGKVSETETIEIKATDTLQLKMVNINGYEDYYRSRSDDFSIKRLANKNVIASNDIRLIVRSTEDSLASIRIEKSARGSSYEKAENRADNIDYVYTFSNRTLELSNELITDLSNKFRDQEVTVILYLPEGSILYADDNVRSFHYQSSYYNDLLERGMEEHYLLVEDGKLTCLDCEELSKDEDDEPVVSINSKSVNVKVKESDLNADTKGVEVKIDEKEGVQIRSLKEDN